MCVCLFTIDNYKYLYKLLYEKMASEHIWLMLI